MIGRGKSRHCQPQRRFSWNENLQRNRIELRNLPILKKILTGKPSPFLSSEQPCEPKSLDVALKIAGVEKIQWNPDFSNPWFLEPSDSDFRFRFRFRFLEPSLLSLGYASLGLYNFTPDFSNPRFLKTPDI